ncbi:MAG: zinc ribbon domain-containing protein [Dehalococcoidia bacterium]|nr:zinc ribbon domain-containing protein [Dehalococcoidia bacterium]MDP6494573.1 zinc ribbon domain-containing protein [Dehalococcoidia bacterium]
MPIYEYECVNCSHRFELKQGFDAEPTEPCPRCQAPSRRRFHAPTVIYKGNGFYTTDYARKDQTNHDGDSHNGDTTSKIENETSSIED